ncbi:MULTISPECIES: hypothetical protein [Kribbella]|uniref:hypothetical protein n=1 Tax=Kribbella TaxID=182639 RepID=UPI001F54111B|nr:MULTISPECIES: hypothetical protein [Kribbella]
MEEDEHHHQRQDRDAGGEEELGQVDGLRGDEGGERDLNRPGVLIGGDDQRPEERVPNRRR